MIKYLEIDSTYRNRQAWPSQTFFEIESGSARDADPVSDATPIVAWKGNSVNTTGIVTASSRTTICITAAGLQQLKDYYANTIVYPVGTKILEYRYLGGNQAELIVEKMPASLALGSGITIADPTDLSVGRVFVPQSPVSIVNYYTGAILYNETLLMYTPIRSYDPSTGTITTSSSISGWNINNSMSIRYNVPSAIGTSGPTSTESTVTSVFGAEVGSFLRLLPTYPSVSPAGEIRQIVSSDPTSVKVYPPFSANASSLPYEILRVSRFNSHPISYIGTTTNDTAECSLRLLNLVIPKRTLTAAYGGDITKYPYVYVVLTPKNSVNINVNCSNNPNSTNALFRATMNKDMSDSEMFVKLTGDDARVRVQFKLDSDFRFEVKTMSGVLIEFEDRDTVSPAAPNPLLQVSCQFEVIRE